MELRDRDMEGVLFTNHLEERFSVKTGFPYYSCGGKAKIDGVEYYVVGFKRTDFNGKDYYNLSFTKVAEQENK